MKKRLSILAAILVLTLALLVVLIGRPVSAGTPASREAAPRAVTAGGREALAFVEAHFDLGMRNPRSVALDPAGDHVYVAAYNDDAVSIFSRDGSTGTLTHIGVVRYGDPGVEGLEGPVSVAVSPDGKFVYVACKVGETILVFSRNETTGQLTYTGIVQDGEDGVNGLEGVQSIAISPDGETLYAASYGTEDKGVAVFERNLTSGALSQLGFITSAAIPALEGARSVTVSPDGEHVYVASLQSDALVVFARNDVGWLTWLETITDGEGPVDGLDGATAVVVEPDGEHVYATAYTDRAVSIFERHPVSGTLTYLGMVQNEVDGVDGLVGASSLVVSADGENVYVTAELDRAVAFFSRNDGTGALTYMGMAQNDVNGVSKLGGAISIAASLDGQSVYALGSSDNGLVVLDRDGSDGMLAFVEAHQSASGIAGPVGVAAGPDDCVYVTGNDADSLVSFQRNPASGALTYRSAFDNFTTGYAGARSVAVSPDGIYIYVASNQDNAVAVAQRLSSECWISPLTAYYNGTLGIEGLNGPQALTSSPNGDTLYVVSPLDDSIAAFDRDASAGTLTFTQVISHEVGMDGAYDVVVSPDGENVYVAGYDADAVVSFDRDASTGVLTYTNVYTSLGTGSLDGVNGLAISPNGAHLYAVSRHADMLVFFSRNAADGELSLDGYTWDGLGEHDGLDGARDVAIGPDGSQIYVVGQFDNALAVFERITDPTSILYGWISFVGVHLDDTAGVDGLDTANGLAVSPDGAHVYVTGYSDDAVAAFARFRVYLPLVLR